MLEGEELNILHVVPGLDNPFNGIAVAAKLIAGEQGAEIVDARGFGKIKDLAKYEEVWVHSCWLPMTLKACWRVVKAKRPLIRMTHANLDPVRLRYHGWKKWLGGLIERYWLRKVDRIVATCEAEKEWIEEYLGKRCLKIEVTDVKRFFDLNHVDHVEHVEGRALHLLYLGRRHPLKGVEYLEAAVAELNDGSRSRESKLNSGIGNFSNVEGLSVHCSTSTSNFDSKQIELKIVSNAFGEEKEKVWDWCDVLVLPTLSENFGLVVAEALERGKRVITTDGAPVWDPGGGVGYGGRLLYLKGFRDGAKERKVGLLKKAITAFAE